MEQRYTKGLSKEAKEIRELVFVKEQGFKNEFDSIDKQAYHLVLLKKGNPIATGRTFIENKQHMIGRIAVKKEYRGKDIGKQVLVILEDKIKKQGATSVQLSAQLQASGFYEKLGYSKKGKEYLDEHCLHVTMIKEF